MLDSWSCRRLGMLRTRSNRKKSKRSRWVLTLKDVAACCAEMVVLEALVELVQALKIMGNNGGMKLMRPSWQY